MPSFPISVSRLVPLIKRPHLHLCILVTVAGKGLKGRLGQVHSGKSQAMVGFFCFGLFERFSPPSVWYIFKQNFIFKMKVLYKTIP